MILVQWCIMFIASFFFVNFFACIVYKYTHINLVNSTKVYPHYNWDYDVFYKVVRELKYFLRHLMNDKTL